MNLTSVPLNLAAIDVPQPTVDKSKDWVLWGGNHGFPKEVLNYIRKSPTASAMFARKAAFIAGEGFNVAEDAEALKTWLENVASTSDKLPMRPCSGNQLLKRLGMDAARLEAFALQVGWAKGSKPVIAWLKHQRIETVASGKLNEKDEVESYWVCRDWSKQTEYPPKEIPAYNPANFKEGVQLLVYFQESPGQEYYPDLSFVSALAYMQAEARLATHHDNNIRTGFRLAAVVKIRKGPTEVQDPNDPEKKITAEAQRKTFQESFKKNFQGENADSILFVWGDGEDDDAEKMLDVETLSLATGETYEAVAGLCQQAILSAGQVTSPVVVGLPGDGGLGGNGSEIREAYDMYNNTVCRPWQVALLEVFRDLAQYAPGVGELEDTTDAPALEIISSMPVRLRFSEDTVAATLSDDEIRSTVDFAPVPAPEGAEKGEVQQTEAQKALSASVGGQTAIDAMLTSLAQNLTTRESCIARLKTFFGLTTAQAEEIVPMPATEGGTTATVAPGTI